ncbi:MAG: helicase, partial [Chlorobi bacterium]|nr:helicase [Chlorobiota bacterium]
QNGRENTKILIVYPPAVEKNWKNTFKDFQLDKYTKFITNGSLEKILEGHQDYWNKEDYDLIIVDEAHKFRNYLTGAFQNLQLICKSPRANKGLIDGLQKKVILVTATPLNNRPDDIFYQIQMFQDARQSTLPITNLTSFFAPLMEQYKTLKRFDELDVNKLRTIYGKIRKNVIEPITIRRTRTDLENIPEYKIDLDEQGIKFPKVEPPKKVEYLMDEKLNELFHKTVFYLTDEDKLKYSRYQAIAGLKQDIQDNDYENAETVSKSLAFIMKTQLIKRLESSFYAFKKSLGNFQTATDRMIAMFENNKDKGAYYTPKEIVHYMCQESLIEYLCTTLKVEPEDKEGIAFTNLLKKKEVDKKLKPEINNINTALDNVKIFRPCYWFGCLPYGFATRNIYYQTNLAHL